ncbi:MAG: glycoside hydrolase family 30 protein, partial [Candidatus Acidiferrales bacterium]
VADVRPAAEIADDGAGGTESERAGVNGAAARSSGATARAAAESSSPRGAITQFPAPVELGDAHWSCVVTTESAAWQSTPLYKPSFAFDELNLIVGVPDLDAAADSQQTMEGFGGCFNELGWTSLEALSDTDRESVMTELFDPKAGARFSYCRMPIGANDFAREPYSYDETDGDFAMDHFSIAHDQDTLVPFIQAALKHQPKLRLWASPWSPPTWMKNNHFYAEAKPYPGFKDNGIKPEQVGHEGEDMFIQEPRYFQAYALYFQKFIEAYRAAGIRVGMVMPQNEFNSAQNFPSCTWTADGLKHFIEYLGPAMQKIGVDVFFGTLERGNVKLLEAAMNDKKAAKYIKGVGVQWAGKNALADIAREFPGLTLFQSEQECGYNSDTWAYTTYCWQLMKEYFRRGARAYMYWNISTLNGGVSTWGWPQNSLVYVDAAEKNFKYSSDYYLLKHLTHYVDVGARRIETSGTCDDALAFLNPNDSVVLLVRNASAHKQTLQVQVADKTAVVELAPNSIGTLHLKSA